MSATTEYLQTYEGYFWRYEDRGEVIAVPNGRTLGYTNRIIDEIILDLAPQGLPRFGSLLLAVAATTAHGRDALNDIMSLVAAQTEITGEVAEGLKFARLLTQVPARIKRGNLRVLLFQAVFLNSHNGLGPKTTAQIVRDLKAEPFIRQYGTSIRERSLMKRALGKKLVADFKTLALIGRELPDVPAILQRLSGLPEANSVLEQLDPEPPQKDGEESLVDELLKHHDTYHVGALIKNLISGLQISFHASLPSEQPLGGVADITNKGTFDKLLTSEHAFEDHVLLSRLANNEVLYKHREVPPADNTFPRVLLIDTTLNNWGTIRTIAFAAALAIVHHPKNRQPCRTFLVGQTYREVECRTVVDVIDGLQTLDASLGPAPGIEEVFVKEDLRRCEVFYIGSAETLAHPAMQRLISDPSKRIDHWIHPDATGLVKVYKHPKRGKRLVQELRLELTKLWDRRKPARSPSPEAISGPSNYPLLFAEMKLKSSWKGARWTYGLTKERALMRLYDWHDSRSHGWEFIAADVRPADLLKAVMTYDDVTVTALFATDTKTYSIVEYPSGKRTPVELNKDLLQVKDFYVEGDYFKSDLLFTTVCINRQGQVSTQRDGVARRAPNEVHRNRANNFFRHVTRVAITNDNRLRIRKHDLLLEDGGLYLRHRGAQGIGVRIEITDNTAGAFVFPDGSAIIHNPNGMLTLRSANVAIPDIHLPIQLNVPIAAATLGAFTGSGYYRKEQRIEVLGSADVTNGGQLARYIKENLTNVSNSQAEKMAKRGLIPCYNEEPFTRLAARLSALNYRVVKRGLPQRSSTPTDFYGQYITPFINHIVHHGTTS